METLELSELRILKQNGFFGSVIPVLSIIHGTDAQASANFSTPFFVADRPYEVLKVIERHETAAADGAIQLRKSASGIAPASGTAILASTLSLTTTANTLQTATLSTTLANRRLDKDDALSLEATGTLASCVGVTVSVMLKAI